MPLFRFNPTIRETNKYLSETTDELLKKHGNVSNEEFEKELVAITGIGWKQVKNYKNHPKPSERIKDNSLVIKFVAQCRKKDTGRKVRQIAIVIVASSALVFGAYKYVTTPNKIETFAIHEVGEPLPPNYEKIETKVFLQIPSKNWVLRLGPFKHSKIPLDKFVCAKLPAIGLTNCSYNENGPNGLFQVTLIMDKEFVRKYSVMTLDPNDIKNLRNQLSARVDSSLARTPSESTGRLNQNQFKVGSETIDVLSTADGRGARSSLTVSVSH
ncbi:MAG: hypothetical protein IPK68_04080 [Bdellovibrionales bacterium]|nr:hypothetical protein [Bdellovibrionales bacterium]